MSSCADHKNISSYEEGEDSCYESDGEFDVYSDVEFDEVVCDGDREIERTQAQIFDDAVEDDEMKISARLQHPDSMNCIRPAREIPSKADQDVWLKSLIDGEKLSLAKTAAVPVIESWWKVCLVKLKRKRLIEIEIEHSREVSQWLSLHRGSRGFSQLAPLMRTFAETYNEMIMKKKQHSLIKAAINERLRMIIVGSDAKKAAVKASIAGRKAGKARALAKQGMNKKTAWHQARNNNSLVFKEKEEKWSKEGEGKRVQRKEKQWKAARAAEEYAARIGPIVKKTEIPLIVETELTDEQRAAERDEMKNALALINRQCVEMSSIREKREADEEKVKADTENAKEKAKEEKAKEAAEFVTVMSRKKKITVTLGFKGLKEQAIERRKDTDSTYNERCNAFEVMADKTKIEETLKFTSICRSVISKKKCYHKDCRFAHKLEDLAQKDCTWGGSCKFVKKVPGGQYRNAKFGRSGKTCSFWHPGESKHGFCGRVGLKYTIPSCAPCAPVVSSPVSRPISQPIKPTGEPIVNVWAKVVDKAEKVEKLKECQSRMTMAWNAVVVGTLTVDEKKEVYGRGAILLGVVTEERDNTPVIPATIRKPHDKTGLGFEKKEQKQPTTTKLLVSAPGFNWVKGAVLTPPVNTIMVKVMDAVMKINKRIAEEEKIEEDVTTAKAKAVEINKRMKKTSPIMDKVMALVMKINERIAEEEKTTERVATAKAKALQINKHIEMNCQRTERRERREGWEKVFSRRGNMSLLARISSSSSEFQIPPSKNSHETKSPLGKEQIVLRVRKADAELALLSALRNGLTNFRVEYIDEPPEENDRSDEEDEEDEEEDRSEEEYEEYERCDCGDCPDCGVPRPHMIDRWGYKAAMIGSRVF